MHKSLKIFIDSSVIIAALISPEGGSGQILKLCEAKVMAGVISSDVISEVQEVIKRKFPEMEEFFKNLIKMRFLTIAKKAPSLLQKKANKWISHPKDALILASAHYAKVDFLLTLDLKHFIKDLRVSQKSGIRIHTPGEFLHIFRTTAK